MLREYIAYLMIFILLAALAGSIGYSIYNGWSRKNRRRLRREAAAHSRLMNERGAKD